MGGRLNLDGGTLNLDGGNAQARWGDASPLPPRPPYNLSTGFILRHVKKKLLRNGASILCHLP